MKDDKLIIKPMIKSQESSVKCKNCRFFRIDRHEQRECLIDPPTPFMVAHKNPIGDVVPAFVSARASVDDDDFCGRFEAGAD